MQSIKNPFSIYGINKVIYGKMLNNCNFQYKHPEEFLQEISENEVNKIMEVMRHIPYNEARILCLIGKCEPGITLKEIKEALHGCVADKTCRKYIYDLHAAGCIDYGILDKILRGPPILVYLTPVGQNVLEGYKGEKLIYILAIFIKKDNIRLMAFRKSTPSENRWCIPFVWITKEQYEKIKDSKKDLKKHFNKIININFNFEIPPIYNEVAREIKKDGYPSRIVIFNGTTNYDSIPQPDFIDYVAFKYMTENQFLKNPRGIQSLKDVVKMGEIKW